MDGLANIILDRFGDSAGMMLALLIFLPAALIAFWTMSTVQVRGAVKRRAAGLMEDGGAGSGAGSRCYAIRAPRRRTGCWNIPPSTTAPPTTRT